jgi:hypothetical protein
LSSPQQRFNSTPKSHPGYFCFKKLHHQTPTGRLAGGSSIQKKTEVLDVWLMFNEPIKSEKWTAGN